MEVKVLPALFTVIIQRKKSMSTRKEQNGKWSYTLFDETEFETTCTGYNSQEEALKAAEEELVQANDNPHYIE